MKYNFDQVIDRKGTNSQNVEGFRQYMFSGNKEKFCCEDHELIRLWIADMEFATPDFILDAMKDRIDRKIFGYTLPYETEYYNSFKNWTQKRYGWSCQENHLRTSPGIIPAIYELLNYICNDNDQVVLFTPSYGKFKKAIKHNNLSMVISELKEEDGFYTIDFNDLEIKLKNSFAKVCIFCNPHNPTGRVWSDEELKKLGSLCLENDVWLISDEVHCDLLRKGQNHTPLAKLFPNSDRIITCMSPSKTFNLAGLLLANIIIPNKSLRENWDQHHYIRENPISISAVQAAYTHGEEWLHELTDYLDQNFKMVESYMNKYLPKAAFKISEATFLAWIDVSAYTEGITNVPFHIAKYAGVLIEGDNIFISNAEGYIRVNLACPRSILEDGISKITDCLLSNSKSLS